MVSGRWKLKVCIRGDTRNGEKNARSVGRKQGEKEDKEMNET